MEIRYQVFSALELAIENCCNKGKYEYAAQLATALAALISAGAKMK